LDPGNDIDDVRPEEVLAGDGEVRGSAVEPASDKGPPVHHYRVVSCPRPIASNGHRARLAEGKEITDLCYDIADLKRQGVKLEEFAVE
jgi:hypothetical protein